MKKLDCFDIFNEDNTEWDYEIDDEGHRRDFLVYSGDIDETCEEMGISREQFDKFLEEYEESSRNLIESVREWEENKRKFQGE